MTTKIQDLTLTNNIRIPAAKVEGFLWGGRETGARWLEHLPAFLESICHQHNISNLQVAPEMRMNLVLFGESATHGQVVLKMAPSHPEIASEFTMNNYVSGHGYPRVIDSDIQAAWLLMERIQPGITMQNMAENDAISDPDATRIAASLILESNLPAPSDSTFPDLKTWLKALFDYKSIHGENGPLPIEQVELALRHAAWLLDLPDEPRLLHGDFHHGNIIQGEDGWMLIDPKGIIAPLAFEAGPWFYNPLEVHKRPDLRELFDSRLEIFSTTLGIDRVKLWRAVFVACVLSDCWVVEDAIPGRKHLSNISKTLLELPESRT